jgi:replicative DNA helicase
MDSVSELAGAGPELKKARTEKTGTRVERVPTDRLPPNSAAAEAGVLGCILLSPVECLSEAREALPDSNAFYDMRNRCIFDELCRMDDEKVPVDLITLQQRLKDRELLEQVGGLVYLAQLQDAVPSAANLSNYLAFVLEKFLLRKWVALCTKIVGEIYDYEGDVDSLAAQVSADLFKLCEGDGKTTEKSMAEVMADVQEEYLDKFRRGVKRCVGPQTGFNYLDNIIPGLAPGQLILIAARPRTGKSAMMMQMAANIAGPQQCPVGIFSLEMTSRALGARAIFERGGADMTKFLNGFMSDADVQKLVGARLSLAKLPIFFEEAPTLAIEELEIRARRLVRKHGLKILFLDYFQLLYSRNKVRSWNTNDELAYCSKRLKGLARELGLPIVLCAQMNREIEKETHRRPRLSDLRDTGQLEQDADVIMFLWKPDISSDAWKARIADILPRMPVPLDWRLESTWKKNLAVVICTVEKQREGRSGEDAVLMFIKTWTRFVDAYTPGGEAEKPKDGSEGSDEGGETC